MDTGSHLLFGVTLAGLAYIDPAVAQNAALAQAVAIGTIIGSNAPDFDSIVRFKGMASYLRHHRGITHSLPALLLWPTLLTLPLAYGFGVGANWPHLYGWILFAVLFHVLLDALNSYGVQCLRPLKKRWIHLDVLAIFDPVLFLLHSLGLIFWLIYDFSPADLFFAIYLTTFAYVAIRAIQHAWQVQHVIRTIGVPGICHVLPSFHPFRWRFVLETEECFYTGTIFHRVLQINEVLPKTEKNRIIQATLGIDGVRSFLGFAQRIHVTWQERNDGYEVSWSDVRFWYDRKLPFGVDVQLDRELNVVACKLGWRKKAWDPPFV